MIPRQCRSNTDFPGAICLLLTVMTIGVVCIAVKRHSLCSKFDERVFLLGVLEIPYCGHHFLHISFTQGVSNPVHQYLIQDFIKLIKVQGIQRY